MTGDRVAIIDLGSNTFHLLICEIKEDHSWSPIHKERIYVKLASGGLHRIDDESIERGLDAMKIFATQIKAHGVVHTKAIGTAALREAENGKEVADFFSKSTGIEVEIVDGSKEADYILRGIKSAIPPLDQYALIMDIGGGSVEFILFHRDSTVFKGSYKIGVAVLYRLFHHSDPISLEEISTLEQKLRVVLNPLIEAVKKLPAYYLIGASGSFEVIQDVLPKISSGEHWAEIDISGIMPYLDEIVRMDLKSRRQNPGIPIERLDYIVVAYLLIRFIFRYIPPEKLIYCEYALKEGVLDEFIKEFKFRLI